MGSPVEAFAVFSRILSDLEARIRVELEKPELNAKRLLRKLPKGLGFTFSFEFARSSGLTVQSLDEFGLALKKVDGRSIRFHIEKGDFQRWIEQIIGDEKLADMIAKIKISKKSKNDTLRNKILNVTKRRLKELKDISYNKTVSNKKKNISKNKN